GAGDVTGDGVADIITGADAGGGPHVQVFDGVTGAAVRSFFPFDPAFTGGVRVAAGGGNGQGQGGILVRARPGSAGTVRGGRGRGGAVWGVAGGAVRGEWGAGEPGGREAARRGRDPPRRVHGRGLGLRRQRDDGGDCGDPRVGGAGRRGRADVPRAGDAR